MALKLLTPQEVKDTVNQETARQALRTKATTEAAQKANMNLAKAEADFASALARHRKEWEQEELEYEKWKADMEAETRRLYDERAKALIPISVEKEKVDNLYKEVGELFTKVKEKEEYVERTQEILEEKLDELGSREADVRAEEERVLSLRKGAEAQQEATKAGSEALTRSLAEFARKTALKEAELADRNNTLTMAELSYTARMEAIKRTIQALEKERLQLADQRATLEREYKRRGIPL